MARWQIEKIEGARKEVEADGISFQDGKLMFVKVPTNGVASADDIRAIVDGEILITRKDY